MATTFCIPLDNISTTLAADYTAGGTSFVVAIGTGVLFGSTFPIRVTLVPATTPDTYGRIPPSLRTTVATFKITGRTADTLTGPTLDSGTDRPYAIGDIIAVTVDAKSLSDIHTAVNTLETAGGGTGTVTTVSVATANGLGGTVANPTTTPAITLTTSVTGVLKGNGAAISAAVAGTDYLAPAGSGAALTGITEGQVTSLVSDLAAKAPLASPALTGVPTVPTATLGTNTTQAASTAFVIANAGGGGAVTSVAGRTGAVVLAEADVTNLTTDLGARALDAAVVHLAGAETITGVKTLTALTITTNGFVSRQNNLALIDSGNTGYGTIISTGYTNQIPLYVAGIAGQTAPLMAVQQRDNLGASQMVGHIDAGFSVNTQASYLGYIRLCAQDFNVPVGGREGISIGTTGSAATLSFYGATRVVKAASPGVAAGADAAVVNAVVTALRNLGLVT